ncbi:hypothetical protein ACHAWT_000136 [Skeletonema menzelii]
MSNIDKEDPPPTSAKEPAVDSDEEDDEDYVPGLDPDEGVPSDDENDTTGTLQDEEATGPTLSITKQKAVDDAFNELFGYNYSAKSAADKANSKFPAKCKSALQKQKNILSSIFGKTSSSKLMSSSKATAALARPKASSGGVMRLEKRVIKEVKRFAGQEICVEKVVMVPIFIGPGDGGTKSSQVAQNGEGAIKELIESNAATALGPKTKGLDNLLSEMSRPEKLSTISKTSTDWDLFKSKNADEALKEQLESRAEGNDAFLVKKDFLDRVDHRRFELEKQDRDRERASRGK